MMISKCNASNIIYILFYSKVSNRLFAEFVAAKPEGRKTALGDLFSKFIFVLFFCKKFWDVVLHSTLLYYISQVIWVSKYSTGW